MSDRTSQALGGLVPRLVPDAYVRAEVAAFPLTSEVAFRNSLTELAPMLGDGAASGGQRRRDDPTRALWRECERTLSEHASGFSLDRLIALRDFFWFSWPRGRSEPRRTRRPAAVPMHRYLQHLAQVHLEARPGATEVVQSLEAATLDAVTHYRWLTFALPEDLLLAGTGVEPRPSSVNIEPPLLVRRLLDRGVTEIHHHLHAGMDFPLLWASLLAALESSELDLGDTPGQPLNGGEKLLRWLLAAAVTRSFLAEYLVSGEGEALLDFVANRRGALRPQEHRVLRRALRAMMSGSDDELPPLLDLRGLYRDMCRADRRRAGCAVGADGCPETLDEVWRWCDPIAARLSLSGRDAGERWLMCRAQEWLEDREDRDGGGEARDASEFSRLYWQVLRVRCLLYRSVVQRPMTAGLQWFVRFFDRAGAYRAPLRRAYPEISYHVAGGGQPIAALEVRTTPDPSPFTLAEKLWDMTRSWKHVLDRVGSVGGREPEFGVLLHFTKRRDERKRWTSGEPPAFGVETDAEPHPRDSIRLGGRYADFFVERSTQAQAVVDLLEAVPLAWIPMLARRLNTTGG